MFILLVARPETKPHSCAKHVTTYKEHGSRLRRASLFVTSRFFAGGVPAWSGSGATIFNAPVAGLAMKKLCRAVQDPQWS